MTSEASTPILANTKSNRGYQESLKLKASILVLDMWTLTRMLTLKASTLDLLKKPMEPLKLEPSILVMVSKAPTPVFIPKASTLNPLNNPTEPLKLETSMPLNVDTPVDPKELVNTHGIVETLLDLLK